MDLGNIFQLNIYSAEFETRNMLTQQIHLHTFAQQLVLEAFGFN